MSQKTKSGGGRKIGRNKRHQSTVYKAAGRWDRNRKRAMRRHLRDNPADAQTAEEFEHRYGKVQSLGLTSRGKKRQNSMQPAGTLL